MIHRAAILAFWQFGSPGMLLWGLAAAAPILIHLLTRRRYRPEPWAAMTFLLAAVQKSARRIQVEQWLLLTIRTAILLLFAIALADPHVASHSFGGAAPFADRAHVVLVIDGSYSMDYREGESSRFDAARRAAVRIVRETGRGNGYTLVVMGEPSRAVIRQPVFDMDAVLAEIESLQVRHTGADLSAALAEIESVLREEHDRTGGGEGFTKRRVCFLADLQATTWSEVNSVDCNARLSRLQGIASLELIDVGQAGAENLAITRLAVESGEGGFLVPGARALIQADVQNFGRADQSRHAVQLFVGGQLVAEERVELPAGGRATVRAIHLFAAPGDQIVEARLGDDKLPIDNRRWHVARVRERIKVLCIGGQPNETRHIALALAPHEKGSGPIEVAEDQEGRILEGGLDQFDCIFASNIGSFSRDETAVLQRYVSGGGGGLILFLGDRVQQESYNRLLADEEAKSILPARLSGLAATAQDGYALDPLDYQHSLVAAFRGFPQSGLLTTPIWKYVRVTPVQGATTAMAFTGGDAAIVEGRFGRGRCILVATAASPESVDWTTNPPTPWTALPSWPSFPPLVHEMLRFVLANQSGNRNVLVGEELAGEFSALGGESSGREDSALLTGPEALTERVPLELDGGEARFNYRPMALSGIFEARFGDESQRFAVNSDPHESDLTRIDPDQLPSKLRRDAQGLDDESFSQAANRGRSLFRWLLGAVLALLVVEPCLAWFMERGRGWRGRRNG